MALSQPLENNLGRSQDPNITDTTLNSGFSTPLPFLLQKYDQIRFEGNENEVYTIMFAGFGTGFLSSVYLITLDRPVNQGVNVDYFVIRRLVDDPGFIIINNDPEDISQTGLAPSFIIPKYPTQTLKNNLDNIIQNLSAKNLI